MRDRRWRVVLGPVLIVAAATMLVSHGSLPSAHGAAESPLTQPPNVAGCAPPEDGRAWYRLDERADVAGTLTGYAIRIGTVGGRRTTIEAPPESFATGPFGGVVVVGTDDGRLSTVRLVVAHSGCQAVVSSSSDVIRRATVDRDGQFLYTHRVSRRDRGDLGVWRESLTDFGRATPVLDGLPATVGQRRGFVRTFSTQLIWSTEGTELAVQACGVAECLTRVLDTKTGASTTYDEPGQGDLLAVTSASLVMYEACPGLPCPVSSIDRGTRASRLLTSTAGIAVVVPSTGTATLVVEAPGAAEYRLTALDLVTGTERMVYRGPTDDVALLPPPSRALAAIGGPPGSVALVGRSRTVDRETRFLRLADGTLAGWEAR